MLELLKNKRIMIVVAHPDDELLGLGATFHMLINKYNVKPHVVILGEGITSRSEKRDTKAWENELKIHRKNIKEAHLAIGYNTCSIYDFPDNRFDAIPLLDIIKVVEKEKSEFNPEVIFTHHGGDLNIDHKRTFEAVLTCCRPLQDEKVKTIISFETPSGTEWTSPTDPKRFLPNFYVSVDEVDVEAKIKGMEKYEFERREYPHPRSPEALRIIAQRWGILVGSNFAEPFCLIRSVN